MNLNDVRMGQFGANPSFFNEHGNVVLKRSIFRLNPLYGHRPRKPSGTANHGFKNRGHATFASDCDQLVFTVYQFAKTHVH
jgi:hypothetical protein